MEVCWRGCGGAQTIGLLSVASVQELRSRLLIQFALLYFRYSFFWDVTQRSVVVGYRRKDLHSIHVTWLVCQANSCIVISNVQFFRIFPNIYNIPPEDGQRWPKPVEENMLIDLCILCNYVNLMLFYKTKNVLSKYTTNAQYRFRTLQTTKGTVVYIGLFL